jgi:hypothetical protein
MIREMPRDRDWMLIGGGLLLILLAKWLDQKRPFPPVLLNSGTGRPA